MAVIVGSSMKASEAVASMAAVAVTMRLSMRGQEGAAAIVCHSVQSLRLLGVAQLDGQERSDERRRHLGDTLAAVLLARLLDCDGNGVEVLLEVDTVFEEIAAGGSD